MSLIYYYIIIVNEKVLNYSLCYTKICVKLLLTKNKLIFKDAFGYKFEYNLFNHLIRNEYLIIQYNSQTVYIFFLIQVLICIFTAMRFIISQKEFCCIDLKNIKVANEYRYYKKAVRKKFFDYFLKFHKVIYISVSLRKRIYS